MIQQDLEQDCPLWGYFAQIGDSTTSYGSYSGAVPNEKITWGKLDGQTPKFMIESDATVVAPLIFHYVLGNVTLRREKRLNYGVHLVLRLVNIERRSALDEAETISNFLKALVARVGMRILAGPLTAAEDGPGDKRGKSGVVILYESHAALHTYPELGEAFLDIFSCKEPITPRPCWKCWKSSLGAYSILEQDQFDRGIHWGADIHAEMETWRSRRGK